MTNSEDLLREARDAVSEVEATMQQKLPFSAAAFAVLKKRIAEYINELVTESSKIARRHQADDVSAAHVQQAGEYLIASSGKRRYRHRHLGTIGGILFGGAL